MTGKTMWLSVLLLCCWTFWTGIATGDDAAGSGSANLTRMYVPSTSTAYCNDYSLPHYYISDNTENSGTDPWTIFLEGGGLCDSVEQCFKRYLESSSHMLMTSNLTDPEWPDNVTGYGILSGDSSKALLDESRRLLIPYCSSDLWQGNDNQTILDPEERHRALKQQYDDFHKDSEGNITVKVMTFRGRRIFKAVVDEAIDKHDLCSATQILLVGSSAGGVGAVALGPWLKDFLNRTCKRAIPVAVLGDSQWFINFDNALGEVDDTIPWLRSLNSWADEYNFCAPSLAVGYPCCMSTHCLLQQPAVRQLPIFTLFSAFDGYIPSLYFTQADSSGKVDKSHPTCKLQEEDDGAKVSSKRITGFVRFMTEYGGAMNYSLDTGVGHDLLSYFVPSCLQHVYLATSSLWDHGGVLGRQMASTTFTVREYAYGQTIDATMWDRVSLPTYNNIVECGDLDKNNTYVPAKFTSIHCAVVSWYTQVKNGKAKNVPLRFREHCKGIQCTSSDTGLPQEERRSSCPETISFGQLGSRWWSSSMATIVFCCITGGLCFLSIVYKLIMMARMKLLSQQQEHFLKYIWPMERTSRQVPPLREHERISISCLEIKYLANISPAAQQIWKCKAEEQKRIHEEALDQTLSNSYNQNNPPSGPETNLLRGASISPSLMNMSKRTQGCVGSSSYETEILHGISTYFNPGNLIAIMGPSGSGKTTFLDLLTGRRRNDQNGRIEGDIFVNCQPFEEAAESYTRNTGYVLQLAVPYFEELTVRQNLTFAAFMRLPSSLSNEDRFIRVEQVIMETGMAAVADTVVGGLVGAGLSGGQKRRLCVALQMLELPKVLILDEPTSGLDATSSMELLKLLAMLAESQRLVIVTIHQPRLEIFHMFDIILLLCQGELAYYGAPQSAPELFVKAISEVEGEDMVKKMDKNPADFIIDVLSNEYYRTTIMQHYQQTTEVSNMKNAVVIGRDKRQAHCGSGGNILQPQPRAGSLSRIFVYEGRASIRNTTGRRLYLPVIYLMYAFALGSAYFQVNDKLLLMSTFCIWSFAPSIFMFPAVHSHLSKMLEIFALEKQDGIGKSWEVVIQTFLRMTATSCVPIPFSTGIIYLMTVPRDYWSALIYAQLTAFSLMLNMVWTAFAEFIICIDPNFGFKLAPIITSITGFVGGFLIPSPDMNCWYEWLFYINPNYYGYSGMMFVFLKDLDDDAFSNKQSLPGCKFESWLECYPNSGTYFLGKFGFKDVQPYRNFMILIIMMAASLFLAIVVMEVRFNRLKQRIYDALSKLMKSGKNAPSRGKTPVAGTGALASLSGFPPLGANGGPSHGVGVREASLSISGVLSDECSVASSMASQEHRMPPVTLASSKLEMGHSFSIDMEDPAELEFESIAELRPAPKVPPKDRRLKRRDTRSNLMGTPNYEVYSPYTAGSVATNITTASSGSSQIERLQGVLKKSEDRRTQMLRRMDTHKSLIMQAGSTSESIKKTPSKRRKNSKKEKKARQQQLLAAKAQLGASVDDAEADPKNVRFRLSSSFRRSSIGSGSGASSKKGILKSRRKGDYYLEEGSGGGGKPHRSPLRYAGLTPSASFDRESASPGSKRRNSIFSRMFGGSLDDGARSDDNGSSQYPVAHSPLSVVSLHSNVSSARNSSSALARTPPGSDSSPSHVSARRGPLAKQAQVEQADGEANSSQLQQQQRQQPVAAALKGNFKPTECEAPAIWLRRSSDSTATLPITHMPALTLVDEGNSFPGADQRRVHSMKRKKPPTIDKITSASEYLELSSDVAQEHVRQMYTAAVIEEDSDGERAVGSATAVTAAAEEPASKEHELAVRSDTADGGRAGDHGPAAKRSASSEHTVAAAFAAEPLRSADSSADCDSLGNFNPALAHAQRARPFRQESNGSSLLTCPSSSQSTTATSSRSSSYTSRTDPFSFAQQRAEQLKGRSTAAAPKERRSTPESQYNGHTSHLGSDRHRTSVPIVFETAL